MENENNANMTNETTEQQTQQQFNYDQFYGAVPPPQPVQWRETFGQKIERGYYWVLTHKREILEGVAAVGVGILGYALGIHYMDRKYVNPKNSANLYLDYDRERNAMIFSTTAYGPFGSEYVTGNIRLKNSPMETFNRIVKVYQDNKLFPNQNLENR